MDIVHVHFFIQILNTTFSFCFLFSRDMFIDEDMKPKKKLISESNLEYIFNFDEDTQVCFLESLSYEMYLA